MKLAAYKRLFDTAKTRSGRRPISVATLLKKHEKSDLRKQSAVVGQTELLYRDGDSPGVTGSPAKPPKKRGDVPDAMGGDQAPKAENRQDCQSTQLADSFPGYNSSEKSAERLSLDCAIGDERRKWEGPSRGDVGRAMPEKHVGYGPFTQLSEISPAVGQDEAKTAGHVERATRHIETALKLITPNCNLAGVEFKGGGKMSPQTEHNSAALGELETAKGILNNDYDKKKTAAFADELTKMAAVSDQAVLNSVKRLDKLEQDKPTVGQVGRAAGVGAALGPVASLAQRAIAGRKASGGLGPYRGPRDLAASAVHGAIAGGFVPVLRRSVDQHAEKKTIKNYLNQRGQ